MTTSCGRARDLYQFSTCCGLFFMLNLSKIRVNIFNKKISYCGISFIKYFSLCLSTYWHTSSDKYLQFLQHWWSFLGAQKFSVQFSSFCIYVFPHCLNFYHKQVSFLQVSRCSASLVHLAQKSIWDQYPSPTLLTHLRSLPSKAKTFYRKRRQRSIFLSKQNNPRESWTPLPPRSLRVLHLDHMLLAPNWQCCPPWTDWVKGD